MIYIYITVHIICMYIWRNRGEREKKIGGCQELLFSAGNGQPGDILSIVSVMKISTFSPRLHLPQSHILFSRTQKIRSIKSICNIFFHKSFKKHTAAAAKLLQSCLTLCDPIDRQPTRLPRPWDSPGKNTGVGCHFLL